MVDPYRKAHPHLSEVKKVYEPAQFTYAGNGNFDLENKNFFADFSNQTVIWKLLENGVVFALGKTNFTTVSAQEKKTFQLKALPTILAKNKEYILQLKLVQKNATALIPEGHEIAWDEFVVQKAKKTSVQILKNDLTVTIENNITIKNDKVHLQIDSKTGELVRWSL